MMVCGGKKKTEGENLEAGGQRSEFCQSDRGLQPELIMTDCVSRWADPGSLSLSS